MLNPEDGNNDNIDDVWREVSGRMWYTHESLGPTVNGQENNAKQGHGLNSLLKEAENETDIGYESTEYGEGKCDV